MTIVTQLKEGVFGTTRQLYLAGLGVAVTVTDRSKKTFEHFVEKGQSVSKKVNVSEETTSRSKRVREFADKATDRIQETVSGALGRLGIPTRDEVQALSRNVEQLTEKVKNFQTESVA